MTYICKQAAKGKLGFAINAASGYSIEEPRENSERNDLDAVSLVLTVGE